MNVSIEDKKVEAIERMKLLGICPQTVAQFKNEGKVSISEPPLGAYYWANEDELPIIREFEEKWNALVYTGIRTFSPFGQLLSFLYISDNKEEWAMERGDMEKGIPTAYVYNLDTPEYSQIGCIGIRQTPAAGLARAW